MAIFNKTGLKLEIATLFPDNTTFDITPADLRNYLDSQVDSSLAFKTEVVSSTPFTIADDTDLVIANPGSSVLNLPTIANFKSRGLTLFNESGGIVTANATGGDTVGGMPSTMAADDFGAVIVPSGTNWVSIIDSSRFQLSALLDTTITSPVAGDMLRYDGSTWVNQSARQFAYFYEEDSTATTTISAANTFVDVNGTLTKHADSEAADLNVSGVTVTWTGTETSKFLIQFNVSAESASSNNLKYQFRLIQNGATPIFGKTEMNASNVRADSGSICTLVELATNDTVAIQVAAVGHTTNIEVEEITICFTQQR